MDSGGGLRLSLPGACVAKGLARLGQGEVGLAAFFTATVSAARVAVAVAVAELAVASSPARVMRRAAVETPRSPAMRGRSASRSASVYWPPWRPVGASRFVAWQPARGSLPGRLLRRSALGSPRPPRLMLKGRNRLRGGLQRLRPGLAEQRGALGLGFGGGAARRALHLLERIFYTLVEG